jgi:geranylgeranyl pyrophosphate synthase/predicted secreted hydrolase
MGAQFKTSSTIPVDWPAPGPIDLSAHDLPHASSAMEWWYVNAHLSAEDGRELSLFAAFFRVDTTDGDKPREYGHFLTWGIVDPLRNRFYPHTLLDPKSPSIALHDLDNGSAPRDQRVSRALREMLVQGRVPLPDRLMEREGRVKLDALDIDFDGNCFRKLTDGIYEMKLLSQTGREACRLQFTLEKPVVRHGDDGVVRGLAGSDMFYYFSPRCRVEGSVTVEGTPLAVTGSGWYDHEFGEHRSSSGRADSKVGWNWISAQLDNGYDVTAYDLVDKSNPSKSHGRWVILIDPSGGRHPYTDFSFEALDTWTSTRTFNEYPTRYRLEVDRAGLVLDISAALPAQEIMTVISAPAFWEGRVSLNGSMNGEQVSGRGFVERSGFSVVETTDDFFSSVGRETRRAIDALLPERLTPEMALPLLGGTGRPHYLDGVDLEQFSRTVIQPLREMIFRGGKAWRSYGILACMDLVGGDSQRLAHWLALPELLHVGSLIVDDVQDGSDIRRGGPSCHKLYGEALAINAGCAAYFLAQIPIGSSGLDGDTRVRIYEAYFDAMRAAHAGQACDIDSLVSIMPYVVESGDGASLEKRVLGTHRLKSAAPPAAIARMAALLGGGTEKQSESVGLLFESYGLAFQIIDDVLNLRGFQENRKNLGEDITRGKITAPVAKAMGRLGRADRGKLWSIIDSKPADPETIREAIDLIDACGALQACSDEAHELVESTWTAVESQLPDSQFKVRMRSFGWFVLDRHY